MATTTTLHPRLSLNAICSMRQSFDDDLVLWEQLGVEHVGLIAPKLADAGWDYCLAAITERGLRISSMSTYWDDIEPSIELTAAVGSKVLYMVSGSGGSLLWEEAADQYVEQIAPWVERARSLGVTLAIEPTNPLRTDVSFVHTVRDAADLARRAGIGLVVDVYSSWYERDLAATVAKNIDLVVLCQIGDFKLGTFDIPNRCAIGEGDIPVERLVAMMLAAGYEGAFDLEILGPPLEEEGYFAPIARSLERASEMLARLDPVS
jgi:sugar phosphate isomerase/epimerase